MHDYLFYSGLHEDEVFVRPFSTFFNKLEKGEPLEYINNNSFFFEHNFYVTPSVLIPRSETEILVEDALSFLKKNKEATSVCEVGVGSGAIILSIMAAIDRPLNAQASDISEDALVVARKNYFRFKNCIHPQGQLELKVQDRLFKEKKTFDLIVSNPPYIMQEQDRFKVHNQVLKFEPAKALFLQDDQYQEWFAIFFEQVRACLNAKGMFIMEGHEDHLQMLQNLARSQFAYTRLSMDLTGRIRFLHASNEEF